MRYTRVGTIPFNWETRVRSQFIAREHGAAYPCLLYEVLSQPGRALSFNILLECGAAYNNVPIQAFGCATDDAEHPSLHQAWSCLSEAFTITRTPIFDGATPVLSERYNIGAPEYRFTIAWLDGQYVEDPAQDKFGHIFERLNGEILCLPNNDVLDWRIKWYQRKDAKLPPLKRNTQIWRLP